MVEMVSMELPDFAGLSAVVARMKAAHLDFLVVYADRKHCANMTFLTGFNSRFEQALLLLDTSGRRWLLVGNDCLDYLPDARSNCETVSFQEFSLMGRPRGDSRGLRAIFAYFGIAPGVSVGCAGWKYFEGPLIHNPASAIEIPAFIVDLLRDLAGDAEKIRTAGGLWTARGGTK